MAPFIRKKRNKLARVCKALDTRNKPLVRGRSAFYPDVLPNIMKANQSDKVKFIATTAMMEGR
jgi:hypothetical protein